MSPAAPGIRPVLHQTYAAAVPELSVPWQAAVPPDPRLVLLDEDLARELGFDPQDLREEPSLGTLTGTSVQGTTAQAYSGHQFGSPNPRLGDGRALLLGDIVDAHGMRRDLHLKGSGRTPFSRGGDGRAPLGPMLREVVIGETLHALGIPTTRGLSVVSTGEQMRRNRPDPEPGAILLRVAASHLRVGTFQYAAWNEGPDVLRALLDHAIERHHPAAREAEDPALALLAEVSARQAELVASWMSIGFVHGVMNTDNMTISGESIDFGPCAFLDVHRSGAVFSSIDRQGRYAYGNQPGIALWNLSRFAEALLPVIDAPSPDDAVLAATSVLEGFAGRYDAAWTRRMSAKLGIPEAGMRGRDPEASAAGEPAGRADADTAARPEVASLASDALTLLEDHGIDHTGFFRALTEGTARRLFDHPEDFDAWDARRLELRATGDATELATADATMSQVNPIYIPRNHHLDRALLAAEAGDLAPVERLLAAIRSPVERRPGLEDLESPGGPEEFLTFCGT